MCSIYQSLDVNDKKSAFLELPNRLNQEKPIWEAFSKCWAGKLFSVFILSLHRKLVSLTSFNSPQVGTINMTFRNRVMPS